MGVQEINSNQRGGATTGFRIRDAVEGDRGAVRDVTLSAFQEYATVIPSHWEGYCQTILSTLADVKPAEQIVADRNGAVVGTALVYPAGTVFDRFSKPLDIPEIRLLAVSPTARGRGVGAALLRECVRRAQRSGARAVTLHTSDFMRVGKGMYERMGFVRAPELDLHPTADLTIMGYRLALDHPTSQPVSDPPSEGPPV
jgi:GNAT superfamily N-acetyltransferase